MSGLKSAWELSMEKSEKMLPDLKKTKKTHRQPERSASRKFASETLKRKLPIGM